MTGMREIFRICPSCGRRFHIKLVGEKLTDEEKHYETVKQGMMSPVGDQRMGPTFVVVEQDVPVEIDVKDFAYTYKCAHCGHVWTELHQEESGS